MMTRSRGGGHWREAEQVTGARGHQGTDLKAKEANQSNRETLGAEMNFSQRVPCPKQLTHL